MFHTHVTTTILRKLTTYCNNVILYISPSRLTVVSHKAKKKQHARTSSGLYDHYSELFTQMAALKFENTVTQLL